VGLLLFIIGVDTDKQIQGARGIDARFQMKIEIVIARKIGTAA
jgi:hypothetical protein